MQILDYGTEPTKNDTTGVQLTREVFTRFLLNNIQSHKKPMAKNLVGKLSKF